ncbi:hypothetical protein MXM82_00580 [Pseudomonas asiatica]|nr:hypothetical protein [Pseudomonas asiatica]
MQLTFLGGTGTVTGSKFLLTRDTTRVLIDRGSFVIHGEPTCSRHLAAADQHRTRLAGLRT